MEQIFNLKLMKVKNMDTEHIEQLLSRVCQSLDIYKDNLATEVSGILKGKGLKPQQREYLMAILYTGHNHLPMDRIRYYSQMSAKRVFKI